MDDLQKPVDLPNTVTVGHICFSCGLLSTNSCPYGNHTKTSVSQYKGDIRGKCSHYQPVLEAKGKSNMIKTAKEMTDAELNIAIYKKIFAMDEGLRENTEKYWEYLFPKDYAEKMVDDINDSKQKGSDKGLRTTKVKEDPKKIKDKEKSEKQEKDENSTSSWFKRKNKKEIKMVEPFKR